MQPLRTAKEGMNVVTIITYNDWPLIKDCIESVYDKADSIIVVDGRYRDFPGKEWLSNDGTWEYLNSLDKITLIAGSRSTEYEKRNYYLMQCSEGDIVLNLDADEVLVGEFPQISADWGIIKLYDGPSRHVKKRASRLFRYREGMQYRNVHFTLYWQGRQINKLDRVIDPDTSVQIVEDSYIEHNWHLRSQTRRHDKSIYYKKLVKLEKGYPR